jgi:formylglycine-generating enzyme
MRAATHTIAMRIGMLACAIVVAVAAASPACSASPALASNAGGVPAGMRMIPAGTYEPLYKNQGARDVGAFLLDENAVTNAEFLEFVVANPKWRRSNASKLFVDAHYLEHWKDDVNVGDPPAIAPDAPVTHVSWFAARAYAKWRGKRLPTEAEWELAGQASETNARGKDDPQHVRRILEWYSKPTHFPLPPVASMRPDVHGVRGLHGLVWEWVEDFNTAMVTGESRADAGLDRNLFCGSGSVGAADVRDYAAFMRYAFRSSLDAKYAVSNLGFRCARDVSPAKGATR